MAKPIELIIYNSQHEPIKTLSASLVPWGLLKEAFRMGRSFSTMGSDEKRVWEAIDNGILDEVIRLIAKLFQGQATVEEIENGCEAAEIFATFTAITKRAANAMGVRENPPPPG